MAGFRPIQAPSAPMGWRGVHRGPSHPAPVPTGPGRQIAGGPGRPVRTCSSENPFPAYRPASERFRTDMLPNFSKDRPGKCQALFRAERI